MRLGSTKLTRVISTLQRLTDREASKRASFAGGQVARYLCERRIERGIDLDSLAAELRMRPAMLEKLEAGKGVHHLEFETLVAWAQRLDLALEVSVQIPGMPTASLTATF